MGTDPEGDPDPDPDADGDRGCAEPDCDGRAAVRLHVPWAANREVCAACARALVQQEGVVAEPLADGEGNDDAWP